MNYKMKWSIQLL